MQRFLTIFLVACSLMVSGAVFAQDYSLPKCSEVENVEDIACYFTQDCYTIESTPTCGGFRCLFTLDVFKGEEKIFTVINNSNDVDVLSDQCLLLNETDDYGLYGEIPKASGAIIPMKICKLSSAVDANFFDETKDLLNIMQKNYVASPDDTTAEEVEIAKTVAELSREVALQYDVDNRLGLRSTPLAMQVYVKAIMQQRLVLHTLRLN